VRRLYRQGQLKLVGQAAEVAVERVLAEVEAKGWEVFAKPFSEPSAVYDYLSQYVQQVAISNYRLLKLARGWVTFQYYDNKERAEVGGKGPLKEVRLPAVEFIRRLLLHVLPVGFKRIRYYGLHHPSARQEKLPRCRELLGLPRALPVVKELLLLEWLQAILGDEADRCPQCGAQGSLLYRREFERLPWLVLVLVSLVGRPTAQGVSY
jgi:hypothetical protein